MTMTSIRASVSTTDFRNLIERAREALGLPLDKESLREITGKTRELEDLMGEGLGHPQRGRHQRRNCPDELCLHQYQGNPWRELKMAELGKDIADLLDEARFNYKWRAGEDPLRAANLSRRYSVRRPHIGMLIRSLAKQIDQSARGAIRAGQAG